MSSENFHKRKIFFTNPKLQKSFIIFSCATGFVSALIIYVAILIIFWKFKLIGLELGIPKDNYFYKFIAQQEAAISLVFLIALPIIFSITTFFGLRLSHRIAGPINNLTRHLENINKGSETKKVKFRNDDYFLELEKEFNTFISQHEKK
jgi:methyl-accepting chemotaxis protein